uniref:Gag protein n=1 Tax=Toxocara canis TaxID=6265 RepID=A0A183UYV8_TOXCA
LEGLEETSVDGQAISKSRTRQRPSSESYTSHTKDLGDWKKDTEIDDRREHEQKKNAGSKTEGTLYLNYRNIISINLGSHKTGEGSKCTSCHQGSKNNNGLRPIRHPHTEKQEKIAQGNVRRRTDYPTMDDVASDWGTEDDEREQSKGGCGTKSQPAKSTKK